MFCRNWLTAIAISTLAPALAGAQVVRGVVTDSTNRPISGVVVMLVDATSQSRARALSDERGEFRIAAPAAGTYSLRTLRIGFRPTTTPAIELRAGGEVTQRVLVAGLPITLDTIKVADRNVCKAFTDSGAATYAVWEQVRAALTATELTTAFRNIAATTVAYERVLDPRGSRFYNRRRRCLTGYVNRPWLSLPPDSLRRIGYVVTQRDNSVVVLRAGDRRAPLAGIRQRPLFPRHQRPEARGADWSRLRAHAGPEAHAGDQRNAMGRSGLVTASPAGVPVRERLVRAGRDGRRGLAVRPHARWHVGDQPVEHPHAGVHVGRAPGPRRRAAARGNPGGRRPACARAARQRTRSGRSRRSR